MSRDFFWNHRTAARRQPAGRAVRDERVMGAAAARITILRLMSISSVRTTPPPYHGALVTRRV